VVAAFRAGKAGARYVRKAADEVLKVAEAATPRDVIETVLAMSMMEELDRRRFRSDSGFRFQRVRRVRALRKLPRETPYVFTTEQLALHRRHARQAARHHSWSEKSYRHGC
jgi:hypothetical protein